MKIKLKLFSFDPGHCPFDWFDEKRGEDAWLITLYIHIIYIYIDCLRCRSLDWYHRIWEAAAKQQVGRRRRIGILWLRKTARVIDCCCSSTHSIVSTLQYTTEHHYFHSCAITQPRVVTPDVYCTRVVQNNIYNIISTRWFLL